MHPSTRIIVNTLAQYARTIINMILSLYSSRLVLNILGVEDYGIYALIAGVVSMLSFITNSLIGSTQRFLSVGQGKGDTENLKTIFSNSLIIHLLIGLLITIALELFTTFLFDGFLNIPLERENVAKALYQQVVWLVYLSFIASPFRALLVSRENIVYTSFVDVLNGVLKVVLVLGLPFIPIDKLLAYGWIMFAIQFSDFLAYMVYCYIKYEECVFPRFQHIDFSYLKELSTYTGWIIYSTAVIALKIQGVAILLNKFYGAAINAAYGIGSQIAGMLAFVSSSFTNAISPQLMAAEGASNRSKMWLLAEVQSKFSFLLLAMLAVPTIFEMQTLLKLWLGQVPDGAILFGILFIAMQTFDQLSAGLGQANRAIGNIRKYTIVTYTPKLFVIPMGWILLKLGANLISVAIMLLTIEYFCMLLRIWLFRNTKEFNVKSYCYNVLFKTIYPVISCSFLCLIITHFVSSSWRFLITYSLSVPLFILITYTLSLNQNEKNMVSAILSKILHRQA